MNDKTKRILAWTLAVCMTVGMLPDVLPRVHAEANEESFEETEVEVEEEVPPEAPAAEAAVQISEDTEEDETDSTESEETESPAVEEISEILTEPLYESFAVTDSNIGTTDEQLWEMFNSAVNDVTSQGIAHAYNSLNENEKSVYNQMKVLIQDVADGKRTDTTLTPVYFDTEFLNHKWTAAELGIPIVQDNAFNQDVYSVVLEKYQQAYPCDFFKVWRTLRADCPYELYWAYGCQYSTEMSARLVYEDNQYKAIVNVKYDFTGKAADEFCDGDESHVNSQKTAQVAAAKAKTQQIVSSYAGLSDNAKLTAYRDTICELTDYNTDAANNKYPYEYGNPWQLIWVFDGDPATTVVCEGYAKAFQYLCELSTFTDVDVVYSVTGTTNGPHMWNLVRYKNGTVKLVDVTNYDSGWHNLFLATPDSGNVQTGYQFGNFPNKYIYDQNTLTLFPEKDLTVGVAAPVDENIVASGECGENLTWELDKDGVLTISGTGAMDDYFWDYADDGLHTDIPWYAYREQITEIVICEGVTSIGMSAFYDCGSLTSVTIPKGVTSIGVNAFVSCSSLSSVTIPEGVTSIGNSAFSHCTGLTSVTIPDSVTSIGDNAFFRCEVLESVTIPDGVTSTGNGAFSGCTGLTSVTIPEGVTSIGRSAFFGCSSLTNVSIPNTLTSIEAYAFFGCSSLESLTIPEGVTSIGDNAFRDCAGLTSVTFPSTLTDIYDYAFSDSGLKEIFFDGDAPSIATYTFVDVTAIAYYHASKAGWDEAIKNTYGGNITWVALNDLSITAQPQDQEGAVGETVTFTVEAEGNGLTYQWQFRKPNATTWNNSSAADSKTASIRVGVQANRDGQSYRCIVKDKDGNTITSEPATLTVGTKTPFAITAQPQNQEGAVGENVTFTVQATGEGLTYQWQFRKPNATGWNNSSAADSKNASIRVGVQANRDGQSYRCIVKDKDGNTITSEPATLTVVTKTQLAIVTQPQDQEGALNETVTFSVKAAGEGLTYQWQFRKPNATGWNNSSAADSKTASISVAVTAARNGQSYRCIVKDKDGNSITSEPATLTVGTKTPFAITAQPQNQEGAVGENVTFTVQATGEGLTYQWQFRKPGASTWNNSSAADSKTASISVAVTAARNGQSYRCIVKDKDGNTLTSEPATLTVGTKTPFAITAQPQNQEGAVGENVTFTVQATGEGLTYQWQFCKPGASTWNNSSAADSKTASISVAVTAARNGQSYRCIVKDKDGNSITSEPATLTVVTKTQLAIVTQPQDQEGALNETVTFSIKAVGEGLTYQWQFRKPGASTWNNSIAADSKTASISVAVTAARNGQSYRCIVKDKNDNTVTTEAATLTIASADIVMNNTVYTKNSDGTLTLKAYNGTASTLTIPETVNGMTVTAIGASAFEGNTALRSIDLPDSVTVIDRRAFADCTNLAEMN